MMGLPASIEKETAMQRSAFVLALLLIGGGMIGATMMNAPQPSEAFAQAATATAPATAAAAPAAPGPAMPDNAGFYAGESSLSPSERAGREIWYKATAGNARFHTYIFPAAHQRADRLVPRAAAPGERGDRFKTWGIINDPGCCMPGSDGCPAKSLRDHLRLRLVPRRRRAAEVRRAAKAIATRPATSRMPPSTARTRTRPSERPAPVRLRSGVRHLDRRPRVPQIPESAFRQGRWLKVNGSLASWDGYRRNLVERPALEPTASSTGWPTPRSSRRS